MAEQLLICFGIFIVVMLASLPLAALDTRKRRRAIEEAFRGRQELDERDFYEKYFEQREIPFFIVRKVRQILERDLDADLSRLSAEDDFTKNLNFFWQFDSLADAEIVLSLEEEFQIKLAEKNLQEEFRTVDGLVNLVWRKVREKEESV